MTYIEKETYTEKKTNTENKPILLFANGLLINFFISIIRKIEKNNLN